MPTTLITGIGGFTGRYLAHLLWEREHHVVGTARHSDEPFVAGANDTIVVDLADETQLRDVIRQVRPKYIVHLAAISRVAHGDVNALYEANLIGTLNLLKATEAAAISPSGILLASSANIYGNRAGQIDEAVPPLPANHYGVSKLAMEHAARMFFDRLPITIVRPFNYTGVGQSTDFVVSKLVDHARRGQRHIELGSLDVARDFSDVRMVVDLYARLLETPDAIGRTLNICSGRAYELREIISMVEDLSGLSFDISVNPKFVREGEIKTLFGDNRRLASVIGPITMPPLQDTLRWMLEA